ncbi:MAG: IncP-type conjugal transfer protein TraG [Desulfuromonadales bacterium]|nr:IncP-type conjugal transfer protein TraG [Desulfuromonadales bacterium]
MNTGKNYLLSVLVVSLLLFSGLWVSTQYAAKWLYYQPQLGPPFLILHGFRIYAPHKIILWCFRYGSSVPKVFNRALLFTYMGGFAGVGAGMFMAMGRSRQKEELTSHGTARWAEHDDMKKAGLLQGEGIVLGVSKEGKYLRHDGQEPTLVFAPTGSGKGVGIIIPTLLTWPHSAVITDMKGENWGITSGYRHKNLNNIVMKFDPTALDESSVRFNPLEEVRLRENYEVRDVQNIVDMIIDPQGQGNLDHWEKTGHALLVAAILHVLYSREYPTTLAGVAALFSDPDRDFNATIEAMKNYDHLEKQQDQEVFKKIYNSNSKTHPLVSHGAQALLNKEERERSGVLSTALSFLELYRDPVIARNTACSDFKIEDLMNNKKPVSLYLVIPSSDILRVTPLTRIILNLVVTRLTEKMEFENGRPKAAYSHRLLCMLDELPAFGRLENFEKQLAFIRGYGIKAVVIVQSLNQLYKTYGVNNSIIDNCPVRVVFTPNTTETAERVSRMLGQRTELVQSQSVSGERLNLWLKNVSYNTREIGRPLMTTDEVLVLPADEEIIFVTGCPPIKAKKLFYYKDANFTSRLLPEPKKREVCQVVDESRNQNDTAGAETREAKPEPVLQKAQELADRERIEAAQDNDSSIADAASQVIPLEVNTHEEEYANEGEII